MGHLKSSARLSSSYLPFTSTPNEPQLPFPVPPAARETAACISSVLAERRLLQPPRPSVPASPTRCSHRLPACPGALPASVSAGVATSGSRVPPLYRSAPRPESLAAVGPNSERDCSGDAGLGKPASSQADTLSRRSRPGSPSDREAGTPGSGAEREQRGQVSGGGARGSSARWRVWLRGGGAAAAGWSPARLPWPEIRLRSGSRAPQGPAGLRKSGSEGGRSPSTPGDRRLRSPPPLPTPGQVRRAFSGEVAAGRGGPLVGLTSPPEKCFFSRCQPIQTLTTFLSLPLSGFAFDS